MKGYWVVAMCLALVVCIGSCQLPKEKYFQYADVNSSNWSNTDTLVFNVDTLAQTATHACSLSVRTTKTYPYQDLWLEVKCVLHRPDTMYVDTVQCRFNTAPCEQTEGVTFHTTVHQAHSIYLQQNQYGTIQIRHLMRQNPLPCISSIGIVF